MPRVRNPKTGSVVNVPADRAATLAGYTSADEQPKKAPAKKAAAKTADK